MQNLIEFKTMAGKKFLVEALEEREFTQKKPDDLIKKANLTLDDTLKDILPAVETVAQNLEGISRKPEEIEIEFGLKLTTNVGAIFTKIGGEAHFKISVKWCPV